MFAAVGLLFATSCSQDELDTAQSGSEAQVTFSLGLENNIGTRTRVISDGKSADKLVYAVFDAEGNRISTIEKVEKSGVTFPTKETLTLAKGQTYKVAFWAQDGDCNAYTVDDNMSVAVSYEDGLNNDEKRDAFFKTETFTVTGSTSIDVTLKRPFAQINVGVTTDDWSKAVASGIEIETSKVVIKNAATSINLLDGAVSGEAEVTYGLAGIPDENLLVDVDKDGEKEIYKWLSMSYILTGAEKSTLEDLEFTFHPKSGNDIVFKEGLANVPVQCNWRTNILGQILTGNIEFNISIDPIYDGDYIYPDGSAQELAMAAANGGTITLKEDVVLDKTLVIAEGKTLTVDLNGKSISNTEDIWNQANGDWSAISVRGGTLIIKNGTIDAKENDCYAIDVQDGGKVIIESGTYVGNCHAVYVYEGDLEVKGGKFSIQQLSTNPDPYGYVINCYDANYKNGTATVSITGGTFENFNPGDCAAEGPHTSFVAEGYTSVKAKDTPEPNGTYQVVKNAETADEAKTAIGKTNGIVVVAEDMTANSWSVGKNSTLVVNEGATLSGDNSNPQVLSIGSGKSVTISGEGTIQGPKYGKDANTAAIWLSQTTGTLKITGKVTVKNSGGNPSKTNITDSPIHIYGGTVIIEDGYFYAYNDAANQPNPCVFMRGDRYSGHVATLEIYGGVFDSETKENNFLINVQDGNTAATYNKIAIYGGTFVGFNPANGDSGAKISTFVADGYESVQTTYNGETAWEVRKISE